MRDPDYRVEPVRPSHHRAAFRCGVPDLDAGRKFAAPFVMADHEEARAFYQHHEFMPLAEHPNKLFIAMATVEKAFQPR